MSPLLAISLDFIQSIFFNYTADKFESAQKKKKNVCL